MIFVREFNKNWTFRNSWWANRKKTKKRRNCKLKFSVKWNSRQDGVHLSEGLLTCCWNISSISMLLLWAARKEEKDDQTYEFEQHVAGVTHLSPRQRFPGFLRRLSRTFDDLFEVSLKRNLGSLIIRSSLILSKGIERSSLAAQYLLLNAVFNNRARENYRFIKKKKEKKNLFHLLRQSYVEVDYSNELTASPQSRSRRYTAHLSHFRSSFASVIIFVTRHSRLFCSSNMFLARFNRIWFRRYSCTDSSNSCAFCIPIPQNVRYLELALHSIYFPMFSIIF